MNASSAMSSSSTNSALPGFLGLKPKDAILAEDVEDVENEAILAEDVEEEEEEEEADLAYSTVAESVGLNPKDVKAAVEGYMTFAAEQMKKSGKFKLGGMLMLKLKSTVVFRLPRGVPPITKKPCVFTAKLPSKLMQGIPMKKFKKIVNLKNK